MARRTVFVTGTDAGVGKTIVACALVRRLRVLGHRAIGMKPVETGCAYGEDQDLVAADGLLLHQASQRAAPPLVVSPYRFRPRVAPIIAAELAGLELTIEDLAGSVDSVFSFGDVAVVEGSFGALTPIASDGLTLDLAEKIGAHILVVAPDALGTASQVLLVLEAARRRALPIAGVILNQPAKENRENARMIRERGGVTVFPALPKFAEDALLLGAEGHFADHRIAETILEALDRP